jgi:hypothetical protein
MILEKKSALIIIIIALAVLTIFFSISFLVVPPSVIGTTPQNNSQGIDIYSDIVITFDKKINGKQGSYVKISDESLPGIPRYKTESSGNRLIIKLNQDVPLYPEKFYTLRIVPISKIDIYKGKEYTITFRTKDLSSYNNLPEALQKIAANTNDSFEEGDSPETKFLGKLPLDAPTYTIYYGNQNGKNKNSTIDLYISVKKAGGLDDIKTYLISQGADLIKIILINDPNLIP